jgi:hypothetical protein
MTMTPAIQVTPTVLAECLVCSFIEETDRTFWADLRPDVEHIETDQCPCCGDGWHLPKAAWNRAQRAVDMTGEAES